ncbi:MAG: DUF1311 domain-containing protein [Gloeobacteraceae cyanobacterium ES-bin-144]|nr:DUF1311 domain-containing protein [Verrucomicrobiales bacterium]
MNLRSCLPVVFLAAVFSLAEADAQSQPQLNAEEYARFEKADANLNKVYGQLLAKLDAEGKAKLKVAQRAWVAFRDAQAEMDADIMRGGSAAALLQAGSLRTNTERRIADLKQLLNSYSDP